jgi:hypothetical protein
MKYYKILDNGKPYNGGTGTWFLPKNGPGEWMPKIEQLKPCISGYHLCRERDLVLWLGPEIYEAEGRGEKIVCDNKVVFQQARLIRRLDTWTEKTIRLFACDCAERVAHLAKDKRCQNAINTARRYATGEATEEELAAARDAAWGAAAWDAARAAAWAAAWDAARDAAWAAEQDWQTRRLFEYLGGRRS